MRTVRPKRLATPASPALTPEEGFVLSRIDGRLSVGDLVALTGIDGARVEQIVTKLAAQGAVALEASEASSGYLPGAAESSPSGIASSPGSPASAPVLPASSRGGASQARGSSQETASLADFAAALGMDPSAFVAAQPRRAAVEEPVSERRVETRSDFPPAPPASAAPDPAAGDVPAAADTTRDVSLELERSPSDPSSSAQLRAAAQAETDAGAAEELELADAADPDAAAAEADEAGQGVEESEEERARLESDYRRVYEMRFRPLPTDARIAAAETAHGAELFALCLDPDPRVIAAVLQTSTTGLAHARLVAFHHRTGTGLEMLARRTEFLRDVMVERRLLRNPQCGEQVLSRIMASKRLLQTYKIAIDREIPDLTRARARGYIRQKFQSAPPEDRADLVIRTEARCLAVMTGCTFDARTTAILVGRQYNSVLFIQNLAKFPATPPALLAHLAKQPFVRKIAPLKKLLLQHPNMPGEVKRNL